MAGQDDGPALCLNRRWLSKVFGGVKKITGEACRFDANVSQVYKQVNKTEDQKGKGNCLSQK